MVVTITFTTISVDAFASGISSDSSVENQTQLSELQNQNQFTQIQTSTENSDLNSNNNSDTAQTNQNSDINSDTTNANTTGGNNQSGNNSNGFDLSTNSNDSTANYANNTNSDDINNDTNLDGLTTEEREAYLKEKEELEAREKEEKEKLLKSQELLMATPEEEAEIYTVDGEKLTAFTPSNEMTVPYDIVIPEGVSEITAEVFASYKSQIRSITFPSTLTSLSDDAFEGFTVLSTIRFETTSNLRVTGTAFAGCTLTDIYLANGIQQIPSKFMYGAGFGEGASIHIPASVKKIGSYAFANVDDDGNRIAVNSIANIATEDGTALSTIDIAAFKGCQSMTNAAIPDTVTAIGKDAFKDCINLSNVTVLNDDTNDSSALASIDEYAFSGCTSLQSVSIPSAVRNIGDRAFQNIGITSVKVESTSFNINGIGTYIFAGNSISNVTFVEGTKSIPAVFYHAGFAPNTTVHIPASATTIENDAFNTVVNLTGIIFDGSNIEKIGNRAFEDSSLTTVNLPSGLKTIGEGAFLGCNKLEAISLPESLTSIGNNAFENCTKLTSISLPSKLAVVGTEAFKGCKSLSDITFPIVTDIKFGIGTFTSCTGLNQVSIPDNITAISDKMFQHCTGINSLTIGTGVKTIGAYAFDYCTGLTELTVPNSVKQIGQYSFGHCTGLTTLVMSTEITSLPYRSIGICTNLSDLYLGDKITSVIPRGEEYGLEGSNSAVNIYVGNPNTATYKALQIAVKKGYLTEGNIITTNKITYKLNDGTQTGTYPASYDPTATGSSFDIANPTRDYYVFEGWFLDAGLTKPIGTKTPGSQTKYRIKVSDLKGNVTLYAKWDGPHYYTTIETIEAPSIIVIGKNDENVDVTNSTEPVILTEADKIFLKSEVVGSSITYKLEEGATVQETGTFANEYISLEGIDSDTPRTYTLTATTHYLDQDSVDSVVTLQVYGEEKTPDNYSVDFKSGLWMTFKGDYYNPADVSLVYTKSARTFNEGDLKVYYDKKLLIVGTDYTVRYGNNVNVASFDAAKAPYITITCRGNYTGTITKTFSIVQPDTVDSEPVIQLTSSNTVIELSAKTFEYDSTQKRPGITIKYKYIGADKKWTFDTINPSYYEITYSNDVNVGTNTAQAKIVFDGTKYCGEFLQKYSITRNNLSKMVDENVATDEDSLLYSHDVNVVFSGTAYYGLNKIYLKNKPGNPLKENVDYTYRINPDIKKGKAKITITGKGNFTGTKVIEYNISPAEFTDEAVVIKNLMPPLESRLPGVYKPIKHAVYYKNAAGESIPLKTSDYDVKFFVGDDEANWRTHYDAGTEVTMKIIGKGEGKGNYTGTANYIYEIASGYNFTDANMVSVTVNDFAYTGRANSYKPTIVVKNLYSGATLANNRDYTIEKYEYVYDTVVQRNVNRKMTNVSVTAGTEVNKDDIVQAGTKIKVTLQGKGNFGNSGTVERIYKVGYNLATASATVTPQTYTGFRITPSKSAITLKYNRKDVPKASYNITGYNADNVKVGTGYITVTGTGEYIGSKKLNFRITAKTVNYTVIYDKGSDDRIGYPNSRNQLMANSITANGTAMSANQYKAPAGYEFAGWTLTEKSIPTTYVEYESQASTIDFVAAKPNYRPTLNVDIRTYPAGTSVTVYPYFKPVNYKLNYAWNGGVIDKTAPTTYTYTDGADISSVTTTRNGYTFAGWYYDRACKTDPVEDSLIVTGKTGTMTIYAKWVKN